MSIRLLISDLDGTLLGPGGLITPRTAEALQRAWQAGIPLLVATGRSWKTAAPLLANVGVAAYFILLNGAECRTSEGELLRTVALPLPDARHAIEVLRRYGIGYEINCDLGDFSTDINVCSTAQVLPSLPSFWSAKPTVYKIFAFSKNKNALEYAREELRRLPVFTVTSSAYWNLEVTAREAQKGNMALWIVEQLGIKPAEVLVFGDNDNDTSLFVNFVHTRAVGNATASLRKVAEQVIETNDCDGVAKEIEKVLENKSGDWKPA